jgi:hypothetical protein
VDVVVNGTEVLAINKIGWPGETDDYRVDFQLPSDVTSGAAAIQLTAAWIPGPTVTIAVEGGSLSASTEILNRHQVRARRGHLRKQEIPAFRGHRVPVACLPATFLMGPLGKP